jgi:hypothetical protein
MEIKLKLNGENVVLNISDVTVNGKPVDIEDNGQQNAPEFKDGDFCYFRNGYLSYIFIFKSKRSLDTLNYHAILQLREGNPFKINDWITMPETISLAFNEEKELLLKALKENSLRWDEEAKQILDLKWKPKLGEKYFSFDSHMQPACFVWSDTRNDEHCYLNNKCFKTFEEAEKYAKKFTEILKNRDL